MKSSPIPCSARLLLASLLLAAAGCRTLEYRDVQARFEEAVRADNDQSALPFGETVSRYAALAAELTPAYIDRLDPRLQPNAWTLRAVANWRAGQFTNALQSADAGRDAVGRLRSMHPETDVSRDRVLLAMIPGLVEDSRLRQQLSAGGAEEVAARYADYARRFRNAVRALAEAGESLGAATPVSVRAYWLYQCWRVLQNWQFVLGQLPLDAAAEAHREADEFVRSTLGGRNGLEAGSLPAAIAGAEGALPANHVYRSLIELERRR